MTKRARNRWIVVGALLVGLAIFGGVDWWAARNDVSGDTLSENVLWNSIGRSLVAFFVGTAMGVLGGHFFWPQVVTIEGSEPEKTEEPENES
jgi:hypothetical protein